jgi:hypothetical protein
VLADREHQAEPEILPTLCAHGAAIGAMDEQARFYMVVPPEVAQFAGAGLIEYHAFAAPEDDDTRERMLKTHSPQLETR